mmetsp:Transcript_41691/g.107923  ORF Transcript_41691/g.107923 Transcript_41691/m.107923 type:complete len:207 (-) Transcript_41691:277-897(-)
MLVVLSAAQPRAVPGQHGVHGGAGGQLALLRATLRQGHDGRREGGEQALPVADGGVRVQSGLLLRHPAVGALQGLLRAVLCGRHELCQCVPDVSRHSAHPTATALAGLGPEGGRLPGAAPRGGRPGGRHQRVRALLRRGGRGASAGGPAQGGAPGDAAPAAAHLHRGGRQQRRRRGGATGGGGRLQAAVDPSPGGGRVCGRAGQRQ